MLTDWRKRLVVAALLLLGSRAPAFAQWGMGAMVGTPAGDIGVKLSDTNILHVGVAAEGGYDTNVFYNDQTTATNPNGPQSSAVVRVIPSFIITNTGRDGTERSAVVYTLGANLTYREYINDNQNIRNQRAFIPTAVGTLALNGSKMRLSLGDGFSRVEEAPYFEGGETIKRDVNQATAGLSVSPDGGRLTFGLRYANALDYFESGYKYASTMTHDGMLDLSWKWLPKTALFLQGGTTFIHFLNPSISMDAAGQPLSPREDSIQVRALTGIRGLITPKVTTTLSVGYATAFYDNNSKNPSGVSNFSGLLDVGYMPALQSRLGLTLQTGFRNSPVIGNYYQVESATFSASQGLGRLSVGAHGSVEYRSYQNYVLMGMEIPRKDLLFGVGGAVDYFIQRWFYAGATYQLSMARQYDDNTGTAVPFTKHQIFARLGIAY